MVALDVQDKAPRPDRLMGIRHLQVAMLFLGVLIAYSLRVNMSVAIVAMVDKESGNPDYPEYDWSTTTQSVVLSSFFWGYVVTQIPAGVMLDLLGAKVMLLVAIFVSSLFSIITPQAAAWGDWGLVVAFRVIQGLAQGFMYPSIQTLMANWSPVDDRGVLCAFVNSGAQLGTVVALPVCGILSTSSWGWPATFYVFGALGVVWSALWLALGSNSPGKNKLIRQEERCYIEDSIGCTIDTQVKRVTPLKQIFTSLPVWALTAANCGWAWGFWTLLTEMPTYMKTVLDIDLNSYYSALPYFAMFLLSFVFSWSADFINDRKLISLTASRKLFNSIGLWGPGFALIGLAFATDPTLEIALLTVAVGLNAGIYLGFNINQIDLAPNFAGTLMGLTNGAGNLMSIFGPLLVGVIVTETGSVSQWRTVFFIAAGVYFLTNLIFVLFATAELQPWNDHGVEPALASVVQDVEPERRDGALASVVQGVGPERRDGALASVVQGVGPRQEDRDGALASVVQDVEPERLDGALASVVQGVGPRQEDRDGALASVVQDVEPERRDGALASVVQGNDNSGFIQDKE